MLTSNNADFIKKPISSLELYPVVLYVILDWFFRQVAFTSLQGIWDELLFIAIVGVWIIRVAVRQLRPEGSAMLLPIIAYMTVMIFLMLINSPDDRIALEGIRVMVEYIFWFFLAYNLLSTKKQAKGLIDVFLLVCVGVALYGIYQYFAGVQMPAGWVDSAETTITTRVFSIIGSPNVLGSLMVMALPIAAALFFASTRNFKKLVYAGVALVLAGCLVLTFSRGAWLALVLAFFFLGLWADRRILYAMIIVALLTPAVLPQVYERLSYMVSPQYKASSEKSGRVARWDKALDYWRTSPAVGVGLGQYGGAVAARNYPKDKAYVDNWYIKVGTETGWVGLLATLLIYLVSLKQGRRALDNTKDRYLRLMGLGIEAGLIGVLAHNAVENIFEVPMMVSYYWFLVGILLVLPRLSAAGPVKELTD